MKHARSGGVRVVALLAVVASVAAGVAAFVGCGSDDDDAKANGGNDPNKSDSGDASLDGDPAVCAAAIGKLCDPDAAPCACGLTCSGSQCATPAACDEALVGWLAPVSNTDGTCLRDLGGFVIYSGLDASGGPYPNVLDAGLPCIKVGTATCGGDEAGVDATATVPQLACSYRMTKLANGTWYFVMTAYNEAGVESVLTSEVNKVIKCP